MSITLAQSDFSSCEVSDALLKLGVPHGGHIPDIHPISPPHLPSDKNTPGVRLCGPAYTVRIVLASERNAPKLQGSHFVDLAPNGSVAFVSAPPGQLSSLTSICSDPSHPTRLDPFVMLHIYITLPSDHRWGRAGAQNSVWGGLMTAGAQARGVLGAIVSGRVRDVTEHRAVGFKVFARGTSTVGQSPFTRVAEVQVPLTVSVGSQQHGGLSAVTVNPDDLLLADVDGVVCVPKLLEKDVLRVASQGRQVDARCLKDIKAGVGVAESFKRHRGKL